MNPADFTFINEDFHAEKVSEQDLEALLARGWRHFGKYFFRYSVSFHGRRFRRVLPLRIRLEEFSKTKSLKRICRINKDLNVETGPAEIDDAKRELFRTHSERFRESRPTSILDFLDPEPGRYPIPATETRVRDRSGKLLAVSFADVASGSVSGIYAMFDPEHSRRSLGIYTLLLEMEHAAKLGKSLYYLGYAHDVSSHYDYKKRFRGTEYYDWMGNWRPYLRL